MSDNETLQHVQLQYYRCKLLKLQSKYKKLKSLNKKLNNSTTTITNNHHSHIHQHPNIKYETLLKTLKYVLHHQQEMIECINNILHHPIVHQSTTVQKDLVYLLAKLSHIQNKVSLATGGQTSISSPINLHSQPKLYSQISHKYSHSLSNEKQIKNIPNNDYPFQQRFQLPPPPPPILQDFYIQKSVGYPPMSNGFNRISNGHHQIGHHKRTQSASSNSYSQKIPPFFSPNPTENIIHLPHPPIRKRPKSASFSVENLISPRNKIKVFKKMFTPSPKKKKHKKRRSISLTKKKRKRKSKKYKKKKIDLMESFDWKSRTKSRFSDIDDSKEEQKSSTIIKQQNSSSSLFFVSDFGGNHFTPSAITVCGFFCTKEIKNEIMPDILIKRNSYLSYNIRTNSNISSDLNTMLHIPIFDITRDRSLSLIEKRKLHIIDDLIASILENKDTYLITNALLLSFRAFTSCLLLMKVLRQRFRNPYEYVNRYDTHVSDESKREIACKIQLGIAQMVYAWINQYWTDDFSDEVKNELKELQNDIQKFIIDQKSISMIKQLLIIPTNIVPVNTNSSIYNSSILISNEISGKSVINQSCDLSADIIREIETRWPYLSSVKSLQQPLHTIFNIYTFETIAIQIFLMDRYVFKNIRPRELVAQAWKKKDKWEKAPHLLRMINQFNSICKWVQLSILYAGDDSTSSNTSTIGNGSPFVSYAKSQSKILKFMILLAKQLLDYQDFSSLCAVHGALVSSAVKKLTNAWRILNKKYLTMLENITRIFAWNSNELKILHNKSRGVIVPHIGIILRDVIGIEETDKSGSGNYIYSNKIKMKLLAEQVERLLRWQNETFVGKNIKVFQINHILQKMLLRDFLKYAYFTNQQIYQIAVQKSIV